MKANIQKLIGMAVLGLFLCSHGLPVQAGTTNRQQVIFSDNSAVYTASGTTVGARYSSDSQQYIGCNLLKLASGGPGILCNAQDYAGRYRFCTGYASKWMAAAKAITDSSYINFSSSKSNGNCVGLRVDNGSRYLNLPVA